MVVDLHMAVTQKPRGRLPSTQTTTRRGRLGRRKGISRQESGATYAGRQVSVWRCASACVVRQDYRTLADFPFLIRRVATSAFCRVRDSCRLLPDFMARLAEEIVEEWLNRQGYFTIRGVKIGVHEMDLLAIRFTATGHDSRHIEVQASVRPVSYLTSVPKAIQKETGRAAGSARLREEQELRQGVHEWIQKKYDHPAKKRVRERLAPGPWSRELVVHRVKHEVELAMIADAGITVRHLSEILAELESGDALLQGAASAHLVELVALTAKRIVDDAIKLRKTR
jgi:hypothetical protein